MGKGTAADLEAKLRVVSGNWGGAGGWQLYDCC